MGRPTSSWARSCRCGADGVAVAGAGGRCLLARDGRLGRAALPAGPAEAEPLVDLAGGPGAVERVEVQPGDAVGNQPRGHAGRVVDAYLPHRGLIVGPGPQ